MNDESNQRDCLTELVRRGLIKLRQGELYTAYGFDGDETLQRLLPLPKRDDKVDSFHKFLHAVSELAEGNEGSNVDEGNNQAKSKSNERLSELMRRRNEWIPIIKTFLSDANSGQDPTVPLTEQEYEEAEGQSQQQDDEGEGQNLVTKKRRSSRSQVRGTSELKTAPDASGQPPVDADDTLLHTKPAAKKRRVSKVIAPVNDEIGNVSGSLDEARATDKVIKKRRNSKLSKSDDTAPTTEKPKFSQTVEQPKKKSKRASKTTGKPAVTKELLEKRRKEVKADFEARKNDILEQVPDEVKGRFRQLGFAKWSKSYLPILILSPFDVPPGPVRQQWMKMFENCKKQGRLNDMTDLLYWYGTSKMKECFAFENIRNIVTYETGCKKGYDKVPPKIQKSLDSGMALKGRDLELYNGLRDMAEDARKDPGERQRRILNFPEEYDLIDENDIYELEDDDEDYDEDEDEVIDKNDDIKADTEPAAEPAYFKDQTNELASSITKKPSLVVANDMDAIDEAEMSNIDAEGFQEPESADDDDDFEPLEAKKKEAVPVNKKKRKQPPLPKSAKEQTQADPKLETEVSSEKKRQKKLVLSEEERKPSNRFKMTEATTEKILPSTKRSPEAEQKLFTECQERYFPLVEKWQQAIEERNVEALTGILRELNPLVDKFSASFFEAHRLNEMMRPKTKELVKESEVGTRLYHGVWNKMKAAYKEKKTSMPDDFVLSKRQQTKDSGMDLKRRDLEHYNCLCDMAEDSSKDPSERQRGSLNFPEEYDLVDELGEDDNDSEVRSEGDDERVDPMPMTEQAKSDDLLDDITGKTPHKETEATFEHTIMLTNANINPAENVSSIPFELPENRQESIETEFIAKATLTCRNCGKDGLDTEWNYCPRCSKSLKATLPAANDNTIPIYNITCRICKQQIHIKTTRPIWDNPPVHYDFHPEKIFPEDSDAVRAVRSHTNRNHPDWPLWNVITNRNEAENVVKDMSSQELFLQGLCNAAEMVPHEVTNDYEDEYAYNGIFYARFAVAKIVINKAFNCGEEGENAKQKDDDSNEEMIKKIQVESSAKLKWYQQRLLGVLGVNRAHFKAFTRQQKVDYLQNAFLVPTFINLVCESNVTVLDPYNSWGE